MEKHPGRKTVLVIGAGDAIGSAILRKFSKTGMTVCGARRNKDKLEKIIYQLSSEGHEAYGFKCDARNEEEVIELFAKVEREIGPKYSDIQCWSQRAHEYSSNRRQKIL